MPSPEGYDPPDQIIEDLIELVEYDPDAEKHIADLGVPPTEHLTKLDGALALQNAAEASFPDVPTVTASTRSSTSSPRLGS